jgi:hypothetical protein
MEALSTIWTLTTETQFGLFAWPALVMVVGGVFSILIDD